MSVGTDDKVRLAVLVDDLGARLEPDPTEVLGHETVCDQAGTARLYHCKTTSRSYVCYYGNIYHYRATSGSYVCYHGNTVDVLL